MPVVWAYNYTHTHTCVQSAEKNNDNMHRRYHTDRYATPRTTVSMKTIGTDSKTVPLPQNNEV